MTEQNQWDEGEFRQEEARVFIATDKLGLLGNDTAPYKGLTWRGTYYAVLELVQSDLASVGYGPDRAERSSPPEGLWRFR